MRDILNCMTVFASLPQNSLVANAQHQNFAAFMDNCETQTEIVAVHTPQIENLQQFPYLNANKHHVQRPSTLLITSSSNDSSISTKSSQNNTATTTADDFDSKIGDISKIDERNENEQGLVSSGSV